MDFVRDLEADLADYCLRQKGRWWATSLFYNREVRELYVKLRKRSANEIHKLLREEGQSGTASAR